jgi:hypothetical protein
MTSATITDTVRYENGRSRFKNFYGGIYEILSRYIKRKLE